MKKMYVCVGFLALLMVLVINFSFGQSTVESSSLSNSSDFFDFVYAKWAIIALVISEVAALLPTKVNGIVHASLRILNSIFQKK